MQPLFCEVSHMAATCRPYVDLRGAFDKAYTYGRHSAAQYVAELRRFSTVFYDTRMSEVDDEEEEAFLSISLKLEGGEKNR